MGFGKKNILKNINSKTQLSNIESKKFLEIFLNILNININLNKNLKISKFGTFNAKKTPQRIGRNPKNLEQFLIEEKKRISFKAAYNIKNLLN
jgi:integration host factor subunit alpha